MMGATDFSVISSVRSTDHDSSKSHLLSSTQLCSALDEENNNKLFSAHAHFLPKMSAISLLIPPSLDSRSSKTLNKILVPTCQANEKLRLQGYVIDSLILERLTIARQNLHLNSDSAISPN